MLSKNKFETIFPFLLYLISRTPNSETVCAMWAAFHITQCVCGSVFVQYRNKRSWESALLRGNISITTRNKAMFRWAYYIVQAAWLHLLACKCWVLYSNCSKTRSTHSPTAFRRLLLTCISILANMVLPSNPQYQLSCYRKYLFTDHRFSFFHLICLETGFPVWPQVLVTQHINFHLLLQSFSLGKWYIYMHPLEMKSLQFQ